MQFKTGKCDKNFVKKTQYFHHRGGFRYFISFCQKQDPLEPNNKHYRETTKITTPQYLYLVKNITTHFNTAHNNDKNQK